MANPRNRAAFERGQRRRELIRAALLEHASMHPCAKSLSAKQLQSRLAAEGERLGLSTVGWHVAHIRLAEDLAALDAESEKLSNSSSNSAAAS